MGEKNEIEYDVKLINNKKRERSQSEEEEEKDTKKNEPEIYLFDEGYESTSIFEGFELPFFLTEFNDYTIYERKKFVKDSIKNKKSQYTLEQLLKLDDTNEDLQIVYAKQIVDKLNTEKNISKINILIEKIQKSQIIIEEREYNNIISNISDFNLKEKLSYINYKLTLIESLKILLNNEVKNTVYEAKKALKLSKKFHFNQSAKFGENNFYFYMMSLELFKKIKEINKFYKFYKELLKEMINFLNNEDFNNLNEDKIFYFRYISFLILDKDSIRTKVQKEKIKEFLSGKKVKDIDLKTLFESDLKTDENNFKGFDFNVKYNTEEKKISFIIKEERRINKKNFSYTLIKSYKANLFNDKIINLIKTNFTTNFESDLMENTLPLYDNQLAYYKEIKPAFEKNLKRILSSSAAEQFFNNTYKKKYKDLVYHFNREDVQEEIIKNIYFFPIFKEKDNGFTNSIDMTIVINSIPGKIINPETHCFNRKFLNLGMILVIALHEILGNYMRQYYSLLTGKKIAFNTSEDLDELTREESDFFVEKEFIGLQPGRNDIGLNKCLGLLCPNNFSNYPIFKKNYVIQDINILKQIYENNKELFKFIITENKTNNKDSFTQDQEILKLEDYLDTLTDIFNVGNSFRHSNHDEIYSISFNELNNYL